MRRWPWVVGAITAITPGLLYAQTSPEVLVVNPWIDIVTRLGVPTAFLFFFVWYHTKIHQPAIRAKDDAITTLTKDCAVELSRVNELRVKEAQDNANRLFQRDKESMALMAEQDKTLVLIWETVRKIT